MKHKIVKTCPSVPNFREEYPPSIGLIRVIADMTLGSTKQNLQYLTYSMDSVLEMLLDRQPIKVLNPFGREVIWEMVDASL